MALEDGEPASSRLSHMPHAKPAPLRYSADAYSLEDAFWSELKDIAEQKDQTLSSVVGEIDTRRLQGNLSSAIRLFVLDNARARASQHASVRHMPGASPTALQA